MVKKEDVLAKLSQVDDPELGINIVDLGLIYDVEIKAKEKGSPQKIYIKMTFTTPACPLIDQMLDEVKAKLDTLPDCDVELTVVFEPLWSMDRLSQKAKIKLGIV